MRKLLNKYLITIATLVIVIIPILYFYQFSVVLNYPWSKDQGVWSDFGSFLGGTISPILSFITIFLLIQSLNHQNLANEKLTEQLESNIENENLRTFENLFFNLIGLQKDIYNRFKIYVLVNNEKHTLYNEEAVKKVEDLLDQQFENGVQIDKIKELYETIDEEYNIYDVLRSFSSIVKLIEEKLNTEENRKSYYEKLINLTDYAHLRLICASVQFEDSCNAQYLKNNKEFHQVLEKVNLNFELYQY